MNPGIIFMLLLISCCLAGNASVLVVSQSHPGSADDNPGTGEKPFKTISAAAKLANPGDTVLVHKGVYRERVTPARGGEEGKPIIYQAVPGEEVIIKGSEVWKPEWRKIDGNVFSAEFDRKIFKSGNPFLKNIFSDATYGNKPDKIPGFRQCAGQVFVDGMMLYEKPDERKVKSEAGTWTVSKNREGLIVHFPESVRDVGKAVVEISVRDRIFAPHRRGLGHIHVRGFVFEHCANPGMRPEPQFGAVSPRSGHHWVIENNTIRLAKTIGLDCGSEGWVPELFTDIDEADRRIIIGGNHLIKGNTVSDNGLCGIAGWNHKGTKIIGNIVERNNSLGFHMEEEMGGMKFHNSDVLVEGNLVRDNNAWGIWIDNQNIGSRVTRNVILNNAMGGIFVELVDGPSIVDNNVIAFSRPFPERSFGAGNGHGIYTHDASGTVFANNLVFKTADFGILMRTVTSRKIKEKLVETSDQRILNSVIANEKLINLPYPNQRSKNNVCDFNVYVSDKKDKTPCFGINWFGTSKDLKEKTERAVNEKIDWSKLGIDEWRKIMAMDSDSIETKGLKIELDSKTLVLKINVDNVNVLPKCKPVSGVEKDIFGNPYLKSDCIPGPFQNLRVGIQEFKLWPVR